MEKKVFLTSTGAGTWTVPTDWVNTDNSIEVIGGGGGESTSAGGGGAYSKVTNVTLTPGASVNYAVGAGGNGVDGGDTFFGNTTLVGSTVGAKGGKVDGTGGAAADGIGTDKFSGGAGSSGGGGAAGPAGNGGAGGAAGFDWAGAKNTLINTLTSNGVLAKLDTLYLFDAPTEAEAFVNYANSGTYDATKVNTPNHTPGEGIMGDASTVSYISSNFNPSTATTPNFTQNSAYISVWIANNIQSDQVAAGYYDGTGGITVAPRVAHAANSCDYRLNQNSLTISGTTHTDSIGYWSFMRVTSTGATARLNAVQFSANAQTSVAPKNGAIRFGTQSDTPASIGGYRISIGVIGGGLNDTDDTNLYNALNTYRTAVSSGAAGTAGGGGGASNGGSVGDNASGTTGGDGGNNTASTGNGGAIGVAGQDGTIGSNGGLTEWITAKDTLISSLTSSGVLAKLDLLYLFNAPTTTQALVNYADIGTYTPTEINTPAFEPYVGYTGALPTVSYIDSNFNPSTATTPNFIQDSASLSVWIHNNAASDHFLAGNYQIGVSGSAILPRTTSEFGNCSAYVMNQVDYTLSGASHTDSTGLWTVMRHSSTSATMQKNGVQFSVNAQTSIPVTNANIFFGAVSSISANTDHIISVGAVGNLTATDDTNLYSALNTFVTTVDTINATYGTLGNGGGGGGGEGAYGGDGADGVEFGTSGTGGGGGGAGQTPVGTAKGEGGLYGGGAGLGSGKTGAQGLIAITYEAIPKILTADSGTFTETGSDLTFHHGYIVPVENTPFVLTVDDPANQNTIFRRTNPPLSGGSFTWTGTALAFERDYNLGTIPQNYAITGSSITVLGTHPPLIDAGTSFTLTGSNITFERFSGVRANAGDVLIVTGTAATLRYVPKLPYGASASSTDLPYRT